VNTIRQLIQRRGTLITLGCGVALGLLLGVAITWWWWPVEWTQASPAHLRSDFQGEYLLSVAEQYATTGDLAWAQNRLGAQYWPKDQLIETLERLAQARGGQEGAHLRALAQGLETTPEARWTGGVGGMRRPAVMAYVIVLLGVVLSEVIFAPIKRLRGLQLVLRRLGAVLVTLLVIAYLALFGLIMAERGREGLPAEPLSAAGQALGRTAAYVTDHPTTYYWSSYNSPAIELVAQTFGHSAGLLFVSLVLAVALGVPLGIAVALRRRKGGAALVLLLSVLGVSTPSFLLAMLFWVANTQLNRRFGIPALPPTGFGWDAHLVMPALVLAARPLAQIAQVTYVSLSEVLGEDYIRTARAKGLSWRMVRNRHAMRNILIPILTTLGTSLRFSLASLPVVEYFFIWPGVGLMLLKAIELGMTPLVTDLIVSLGLLFLLINLALELIYPLLDPRLRNGGQEEQRVQREQRSWQERLEESVDAVIGWWGDLRRLLPGAHHQERGLRPLPVDRGRVSGTEDSQPAGLRRSRWVLRSLLLNPALLIGALLVIGFLGLALFGEQLTEADPYEIHGVTMIDGEIGTPPFQPSSVFVWGTDHLGRDMQALVLAGARQTLILTLLGTLARVLIGTVLGMLAGWWQGSWLDRLVTGAVGVWAAFPYTLFAMIVIQALGIQQGMWVFVTALCVVGWGEVAQFIRGQVIGIKPRLYIEAARAVGARVGQILTRHVLSNLLAPILVLAVLEMGGVLMLLSELGFLNIFLGGGFKVEIAEVGNMIPLVVYFSDTPEWGSLLATIRDWWRSYPWMAWYPGIAFFLAIVAFNVWGEGLRRFLTEGRINLGRLFNRYTAVVAGGAVLGLVLALRAASPMGVYRKQVGQFDTQRAIAHVQALASPEFQGRETGTPGLQLAATYIAEQMKEIGLQYGGDGDTYIQAVERSTNHLTATPRLEILDEQGNILEALTYHEDFSLYMGSSRLLGESGGAVIGLTTGPIPGLAEEESRVSISDRSITSVGGPLSGIDHYGLRNYDIGDKVIIVREAELWRINTLVPAGTLVICEDPEMLRRRYLPAHWSYSQPSPPIMFITPEVAERLLVTAGSSLGELDRLSTSLQPGEIALTNAGRQIRMQVDLESRLSDHPTVVGYIPGTGAAVEAGQQTPMPGQLRPEDPLSNRAIIVSAYYDGLGVRFDGTPYPGANDNASGVAAMLEIARVLKQAPHPPKRTVLFVAWPDGERYEGLSVSNVMNVSSYFRSLDVEVVIELSGVGAGRSEAIALGEGSSYRLVQVFQQAAERLGTSTTTRGRGPHYGTAADLGYGGRSALTAYVHWDGSDQTAHTFEDTIEAIDPEKLEQVGQTTLLALTFISRELEY
jgi:ABC-type dipeptide/oligopeptide/nickel transport system permease component